MNPQSTIYLELSIYRVAGRSFRQRLLPQKVSPEKKKKKKNINITVKPIDPSLLPESKICWAVIKNTQLNFDVVAVTGLLGKISIKKTKLMESSRKTVAVIGAGIVGVNTALEVQRRFPDYEVTVIADKFNGETLSDGAAGLFLPDTYVFGPNVEVSQRWINDSYNFYQNLLNDKHVSCGINSIPGYLFSTRDPNHIKNHYMENCLPVFRETTNEELKAHTSENKLLIKYGNFLNSMVIECKLFLPWAIKKISDNGGKILKRTVESLNDLHEEYSIIFNCTGLRAGKLCKDVNMLPIRGQVIRVKAPWVDKFYFMDGDTYIIPSKDDGTVVLGGCRHFGSYDDQVNKRNTEEILENCTNLVPSLKDALKSDYKVWVGLRPYRNKIRVEVEQINGTVIVHNYGHGGYGVTLAPGTVKYALELLSLIKE